MRPRTRAVMIQAAVVALAGAGLALVAHTAIVNLRARGIASGFAYLGRAAAFEIAPGPLAYASGDSYSRALAVGLLNTLRVSMLAVAASTLLGAALGVGRLSRIWVAGAIARAYVEIFRNTPLLLQLFFWYALTQMLPGPRVAIQLAPGVFLCFRGLYVPAMSWADGAWHVDVPRIVGFGFTGGASMSPEFAALLIGLATSTAAFIAEIVRAGIVAVPRGQYDAARALGLSPRRVLRLVVLPQALPAILPPLTSQYVNVLKNSSLAIAIGYADLVSITNTTLNQTGQAIEAMAAAASLYLATGLLISWAMNWWNRQAWRGARTA